MSNSEETSKVVEGIYDCALIESERMREAPASLIRMVGIFVTAILLLVALALTPPVQAEVSVDIAFIKDAVSLLRAKEFSAVRDRLDPSINKIPDGNYSPSVR